MYGRWSDSLPNFAKYTVPTLPYIVQILGNGESNYSPLGDTIAPMFNGRQ